MKPQLSILAALAALAPAASAQLPPVLSVTPDKPSFFPGETATIGVQGLPDTITLLGVDTAPGPIASPWGLIELGLSPAYFQIPGVTDGSGSIEWDCVHECEDVMLGVTFYMQAAQFPMGGGVELSNGKSIVWDDVSGYCEDLCQGGGVKPAVLEMEYTGEDCSATSHSQSAGVVNCSGDPAFAPLVHIVARDTPGKNIWFQGDVMLGATFDIDAAFGGATRLKGETHCDIYDVGTGALLQTVEFHTSCSEPLTLGDQFGSLILRGLTLE